MANDTENQNQTEAPETVKPIDRLRYCPTCGGKVSVNAASCPHCGDPINRLRYCPTCGGKISINARRCPHCGEIVNKKTHNGWLFFCCLFIVFIAFLGFIYIVNSLCERKSSCFGLAIFFIAALICASTHTIATKDQ